MRLRQIEYFVAIQEHGSFTRAARALFVSQPSLSQQILALEKELGAHLFHRVPTGVSLTSTGAAFLPEARSVLAAVDRARAAVRNSVAGIGGELTVMSIRSVASNVLPTSISAWHFQQPDTLLNLRDFHHRTLLEAAMQGEEGDVGVGPSPPNWQGPTTSVGFEEFVLVSEDREMLSLALRNPASLSNQNWVLFDQHHGITEVVDLFFDRYDIHPQVAARSAQVEAAMTLSLSGVGMTMLPENVVPSNLRSAHTVRAGAGVFRELVAYTKPNPSRLAVKYVGMLRDLDLPLLTRSDLPAGALLC